MSSKQMTFFGFGDKTTEVIPEGYIKVKFIQNIPKFVGINLKEYGIFNIGDSAIIPILNSVGLLKKGGCIIDKS